MLNGTLRGSAPKLPLSRMHKPRIFSLAALGGSATPRAMGLVALLVLSACGEEPAEEAVNPPLRVGSHAVAPAAVRAYLARHVGFTSRGGAVYCSYVVVGQEGDRVYVDAACEELVAGRDSLEAGSGTGVPVALEVDTLPAPRIRAHRRPGDGGRYARDLRAIFPAPVLRRIDLPAARRNARGMRLRAENRRLAAQAGVAPAPASPGRDPGAPVQPPSADGATQPAGHAAEVEAAARDVVAFLRGEAGFDRLHLADTVALVLSPEGGGTRTRLTREQLRDPARWSVTSGGRRYSFVPPPGLTKLTVRAGRHFACHEHPLASRDPELARLPHAGAKLEREGAESCLQTWNATFVFDPAARPARLVAAVYDQWEW